MTADGLPMILIIPDKIVTFSAEDNIFICVPHYALKKIKSFCSEYKSIVFCELNWVDVLMFFPLILVLYPSSISLFASAAVLVINFAFVPFLI